jgi:Uri superfamily endonuclease
VPCGSAACMLPRQSGTYVLILRLPNPATIDVGQLGEWRFPAGWYAYVGSARGPGGLVARISRHLRSSKPSHWHIDYLCQKARPVEVWYATGVQKRECAWAHALSNLPGALVPAPRFGASDCRCSSHLVHFGAPPNMASFAHGVGESISLERLDV